MKKLSHAQLRMLDSVAAGLGPWGRVFGAAQHGGAHGTFQSLVKLGLLTHDGKLTKAGKARLK